MKGSRGTALAKPSPMMLARSWRRLLGGNLNHLTPVYPP
jgi:hypothetical protein